MALVKKGAKWVPEWQSDIDLANSVSDQPEDFTLSEEDQAAQDEMVANAKAKRAELKAQGLPMASDIMKKEEAPVEPVQKDELSSIKGAAKPAAIPEAAKVKMPAKEKKKEIETKIETSNKVIEKAPDDRLQQGIEADLNKDPETVAPEIKNDLKWLQNKYAQLDKEYEDKANNLEWRGVMETVAQSLTQLFAAREGLKAGVDMSGLKFNKTDFDKKLDQITADIQRRKGQAENIYQESSKLEAGQAAGQAAAEEKAYQRAQDLKKSQLDEKRFNLEVQKVQNEAGKEKQKLDLEAQKLAQEQGLPQDLVIPGYGMAANKQEAKEFRAEVADANNAVNILQQVKELGTNVSVFDRTRVNKIQQLLDVAVGKLRLSLTGPGAMTKEEREMVRGSLGDPSTIFSTEGIQKDKLDNMIKQIQDSVDNKAKLVVQTPIEKPAGIKPGDIDSGYIFKGGNPADQNNWEKVK